MATTDTLKARIQVVADVGELVEDRLDRIDRILDEVDPSDDKAVDLVKKECRGTFAWLERVQAQVDAALDEIEAEVRRRQDEEDW